MKISEIKNKKILIIVISISAIALILISITSYKLLGKSSNNSKDPSKIIVSNYRSGEVTLKETQIELDKLALKNEKLRGLKFDNLTANQKEAVIKEVVLKEIAHKEAKKRNLHEEKNYKESLKTFENEVLSQNLYADIAKKAGSEEKVKKHYDKLAKDLEGKKDVKIRYISVKTQKEADSIYKILAKSPKSFTSQAKRKSLDKQSAKNGGDLGFVLRTQLQPEIADITKNLKKGEISKPISLTDKWVIIKLEDERDTQIAKFEDVKEALAGNLSQKALQEFISKNLEQAEISIMVR